MKRCFVAPIMLLCTSLAATARNAPSMPYGRTTISLGMTFDQVQRRLSDGGRHIKMLDDKVTALVYPNGSVDAEGQITFRAGQVIYADYQMPNVHTADDLAQEIAGAVDSMENKVCMLSNFSSHGTGGSHSEIIFKCGLKRFVVYTGQLLGSNTRIISVHLEIGGF